MNYKSKRNELRRVANGLVRRARQIRYTIQNCIETREGSSDNNYLSNANIPPELEDDTFYLINHGMDALKFYSRLGDPLARAIEKKLSERNEKILPDSCRDVIHHIHDRSLTEQEYKDFLEGRIPLNASHHYTEKIYGVNKKWGKPIRHLDDPVFLKPEEVKIDVEEVV